MCTTMVELEKTVTEYRSMVALKEQVDAAVEELKSNMIEYLDFNEKLSETGKDFIIKVSACERRTLDSKRLEEDLGDLSDYQKVSQYRRLYVR